MGRKIVFNVTTKGASHVKSGKPCQDYSLSWESEDKQIQVVIVCDGHGGDTYVRSDVGSRLAADIALDNIRRFVNSTSPTLLLGKSGAVTARPDKERDSLFPLSYEIKQERLTEMEKEQCAQDEAFYTAVENIHEQDYVFTRLFASIYLQWLERIKKDSSDNPFTDEEKSRLNNAGIVKAYGSTLMAFVCTSLYWFAFHIGDGKLVACDRNMKWREPVPWDCRCFLNVTTSLCNSNPIPMFRYAFSGKGDFPAAVILGSDGLDDSWGTMDLLQNFYSQTLSIFNKVGEEQAAKELEEYLPELSRQASKDDMSMAGIIDMDEIKDAVAVYNVQREIRALIQKKEEKQSGLAKLKERCDRLKAEVDVHTGNLNDKQTSLHNWWKNVLGEKEKREKVLQQEDEDLCRKKKEFENLRQSYEEMDSDFRTWLDTAKMKKEKLEKEINSRVQDNEVKDRDAYELWEQAKQAYQSSRKEMNTNNGQK